MAVSADGASKPCRAACNSRRCKTSMSRMNSIGDNGSPCRSPRAFQMTRPSSPLSRTRVDAVEMRIEIQSLQRHPKPMPCNTCSRNAHAAVSKALVISNLISSDDLCFLCSAFAASSTNLKLSWMVRFLMKALWLTAMRR
jgi:hypothetical protein